MEVNHYALEQKRERPRESQAGRQIPSREALQYTGSTREESGSAKDKNAAEFSGLLERGIGGPDSLPRYVMVGSGEERGRESRRSPSLRES